MGTTCISNMTWTMDIWRPLKRWTARRLGQFLSGPRQKKIFRQLMGSIFYTQMLHGAGIFGCRQIYPIFMAPNNWRSTYTSTMEHTRESPSLDFSARERCLAKASTSRFRSSLWWFFRCERCFIQLLGYQSFKMILIVVDDHK